MILTKKARCQGCKALYLLTETKYACKLHYKINQQVIDERAVAPKPKTECYKPKTVYEVTKAKKLIDGK